MELQTAEILRILGRAADAADWEKRARDRANAVNRLLWDGRAGLYRDYNFDSRRRRDYPFLTTFYPLWAGIASREQAAAVARTCHCSNGRVDSRQAQIAAAISGTRLLDGPRWK